MKILFYLSSPGGGIGRYAHYQLGCLLQKSGVSVELCCPPEFQWRDVASYPVWAELFSIHHPSPWMRKVQFLRSQFENPGRAIKHAHAVQADVLHFCNINHLSYPAWKHLLGNKKMIISVTAHDVTRGKAILCKPWETMQLKKFYQRADVLFVHSQAQREELVSFSGVDETRIHIVPHGVYDLPAPKGPHETLREKWGVSSKQVALVFGTVRDDKNVDEFLRAAALSKKDDLEIVVAGKIGGGKHRSRHSYQDLVNELGLSDRVHFFDRFITDEEAGELFTIADWVVLTYLPPFNSMSGVWMNAIHFDKPVLATPVPTFSEWLQAHKAGVICDGFDAPAIARGMEEMMAGSGDQYAGGIQSLKEASSWENNVEIMLEAFEQVRSGAAG